MSGWTEARIDQLRTLHAEGLSFAQIARVLGGVTRNAVIGKAGRIGLTGREQGKCGQHATIPKAPKVTKAYIAPSPRASPAPSSCRTARSSRR